MILGNSEMAVVDWQSLCVELFPAKYVGADSETVQWSQIGDPTKWDFGSAANDPERSDTPTMTEQWRQEAVERLANQAEQIGALMCRNDQLEREKQAWIDAWTKERDFWRLFYRPDDAPRDPGEVPAFPVNALKHSR